MGYFFSNFVAFSQYLKFNTNFLISSTSSKYPVKVYIVTFSNWYQDQKKSTQSEIAISNVAYKILIIVCVNKRPRNRKKYIIVVFENQELHNGARSSMNFNLKYQPYEYAISFMYKKFKSSLLSIPQPKLPCLVAADKKYDDNNCKIVLLEIIWLQKIFQSILQGLRLSNLMYLQPIYLSRRLPRKSVYSCLLTLLSTLAQWLKHKETTIHTTIH